MLELINDFGLTNFQWCLAALYGVLIGMAKTGLSALGLIGVVILAALFGGKSSAGIALPLLCFADVIAVLYYRRHANLEYVFRLLPWVVLGIIAGLLTGNVVPDQVFVIMIGLIVLGCIFLMIFLDRYSQGTDLSSYEWLSIPAGLMGGFATMIGNAASPIITIYFLSMRLPKNQFIGTGAWFFLIINIIKLPLHFFFWQTISVRTLLLDAALIPAILFGASTGIFIVKKIPNKEYMLFIMVTTIISSVMLILKNI